MSVRVRFAPSPTGYLHIGNVRTALFNYLFARHNDGKFILRIEDTDVERSEKKYAEAILRDLELLGLDWEEGPFHQSERTDLYQQHLKILEEKGFVYRCYCTQQELQARRREALAMKRPPRYDNRCRTISENEIKAREAEGVRPTIRFKVEDNRKIIVHDLIRGEVEFNSDEIGDFVIMRSDPKGSGKFMPTFHMSVCVDDGLMNITHVIRGEDHLSNSPRHVLLFEAFGYEPPKFAHLSLIHGPGGEPLSKRYGAVSIPEFIEERGYLPEALCNYLALLGWSPKDNREVFTPKELREAFDIANVTHHSAIFTEDKLLWINGEHLKNMRDEEYLQHAFPFIVKAGIPVANEAVMKQILAALKKDIHRFDELGTVLAFLKNEHYESALKEELGKGGETAQMLRGGAKIVEAAKSILAGLTSTGETLFQELTSQVQKATGEKGKKLYMPIRIAVTGQLHGIELKKVFELLDGQALQKRFEFTLRMVSAK